MKFIFVLILFTICSCDVTSNQQENKKENKLEKASLEKETYELIKVIKNCANEGISSFNMEFLKSSDKNLPNSIVNQYLMNVPIDNEKDLKLTIDEWTKYSCMQWEENKENFFFTLLQEDDTCCSIMYLVVLDKKEDLFQIRTLGISGGDGGWHQNDKGIKLDFGKFKLITESTLDTDIFEKDVSNSYLRIKEYGEFQLNFENNKFTLDTLVFKKDSIIKKSN
ncbi:hypothetical protein [Aureivirga sp. CE67]|uniref:hypothetical protein n=1 Tax=Aureivirga sp. CE67 TaxID=1788983 RepID=UPI0018C989E8|nr:hypothetical protein [Aureivirga sp. CE67]